MVVRTDTGGVILDVIVLGARLRQLQAPVIWLPARRPKPGRRPPRPCRFSSSSTGSASASSSASGSLLVTAGIVTPHAPVIDGEATVMVLMFS